MQGLSRAWGSSPETTPRSQAAKHGLMEEQELRTEAAELDIRDGHLEDRSTHLGMSVQESAGGWGPRRLALWLLAGVPQMSDMKPE